MPLKHLSYVETTGQVRFSPPRAAAKVWDHAFDFLGDWVQHIPRARQHQVTYAGWFANALGNLNPKEDNQADPVEEVTEKPRSGKWAMLGGRPRTLSTLQQGDEASQGAPTAA